jgi:hypothetical protein
MLSPKSLALTSVVALTLLGAAGYAQAQTVVKCSIPFAFSAGGEVYPSGTYILSNDARDRSVLTLHNWTENVARFIAVQSEDEALGSDTLLRFNRYGDHYFLSSVVVEGDGISLNLPRSAAEREMQVRNGRTDVTVVVANQ